MRNVGCCTSVAVSIGKGSRDIKKRMGVPVSLRLVKTNDGSNGAPQSCKGCSCKHFIKSGLSWHCTGCGMYVPAELKPLTTEALKKNFEKLIELQKQLRFQIAELERIVK